MVLRSNPYCPLRSGSVGGLLAWAEVAVWKCHSEGMKQVSAAGDALVWAMGRLWYWTSSLSPAPLTLAPLVKSLSSRSHRLCAAGSCPCYLKGMMGGKRDRNLSVAGYLQVRGLRCSVCVRMQISGTSVRPPGHNDQCYTPPNFRVSVGLCSCHAGQSGALQFLQTFHSGALMTSVNQ